MFLAVAIMMTSDRESNRMKTTPLIFTTIQQITSHQFDGNHHHDSPAFDAIDSFVKSTQTTMSDKAEALRTMQDKGMGCGRQEDVDDETFVELYLNSL